MTFPQLDDDNMLKIHGLYAFNFKLFFLLIFNLSANDFCIILESF